MQKRDDNVETGIKAWKFLITLANDGVGTLRCWHDVRQPEAARTYLIPQEKLAASIGYVTSNGDGEYVKVYAQTGGLIVSTDYFGGYPVYYRRLPDGALWVSSDLDEIVRSGTGFPPVQNQRLHDCYQFGYLALGDETIYGHIRMMPPRSNMNIDCSNGALRMELQHRPRFDPVPAQRPAQLLRRAIENRLPWLGGEVILPISAGNDSGILLENFAELGINVKCITFGSISSRDVVVGRARAEACGYEHVHYDFLADTDEEALTRALVEYAELTGGIGTCAEVVFLLSLRCVGGNSSSIVLGGGGEFYRHRNHMESYRDYTSKYLTPRATLESYTRFPLEEEGILERMKAAYGDEGMLHQFYVNERYSKNISRKNLAVKRIGTLINPFTDAELYETCYPSMYKHESVEDFRPQRRRFEYSGGGYASWLNVVSLMDLCRRTFLELLEGLPDACEKFGLKRENIIRAIRTQEYSERDIWFLLRVLNLLMYAKSALGRT